MNARPAGAVPSLFKNTGDSIASRWSYGVLTLDRVRALDAALRTHGHMLCYSLDGLMVAISNASRARELDGKVLDYDDPGYLVARLARPH